MGLRRTVTDRWTAFHHFWIANGPLWWLSKKRRDTHKTKRR